MGSRTTDKQSTLAGTVSIAGVGLHSGEKTNLTIRPAYAGGIVFKRSDLSKGAENPEKYLIAACPSAVAMTRLGTSIQNSHGASLATIEHLMAAFFICDIDHAIVEIDGPELPIADGSAALFVDKLLAVGSRSLEEPRQILEVETVIEEALEDRFIRIEPGSEARLHLEVAFGDDVIGSQSIDLDLNDKEILRSRLAPARTFCFLRDIDEMQKNGFARGGSLENAIVVDDDGILNDGPLRDPQEFALHKALDLLGDLYLAGGPICGKITAYKPGHDLNTRMARRLDAFFGVHFRQI